MKFFLILVCVLAGACAPAATWRTQDHFTTPEPPETVEAALEAAPPITDDSGIVELPYAPPVPLLRGQQAPFPGSLISPFDAAHARLTDAAAERWRTQAVTAEWQLARTERRDAAYAHVLEDRIHSLQVRAQRRQRWVFALTGIAAGAITAASVGR